MKLRSLLFVPGDRPERMIKSLDSGADALIVDLEDSVSEAAKATARKHVTAFLSSQPQGPLIFVRINPLDRKMIDADLSASLYPALAGIVLPKAETGADVTRLDTLLGSHPARILPIVTETARAVFGVGSYRLASSRLCGLTWGAEDLSSAVGAETPREVDGSFTAPYQLVRSLSLFGAHAAGVPAFETVYPEFSDLAGLSAYAARGRRDGFAGMMAIHPKQVDVINSAFRPTESAVAEARKIVALFDANPGAGALNLDGKMIDAPHLALARRLLAEK